MTSITTHNQSAIAEYERLIVSKGDHRVFRPHPRGPRTLDERRQFQQKHTDLIERYEHFIKMRNSRHEEILMEEDYIAGLEHLEPQRRVPPGETSPVLESGRAYLADLRARYDELTAYSHMISQAAAQCDAEALAALLDLAEKEAR